MNPFTTCAPTVSRARVRARESEPAWAEAEGATWRAMALDLVEMDRTRAYRGEDWLCRDIATYGRWAHGLTPPETAEVMRIGRRLLALPEIDSAFCEGWLTWRHVLLLTRVAVPKHEAAWLALALDVPLMELARAVGCSARGWAPPVVENSRAESCGSQLGSDADPCDVTYSRRRDLPLGGRLPLEAVLQPVVAAEEGPVAPVPAPWREHRAPNVRQPSRAPRSTS